MTEKNKPARASRRVVRPGDAANGQAEPPADLFEAEKKDAAAASQADSNDARLKADKPPHWG